METRVTLIYLEFFSAFFEPKISKIQKTGKIENLFFFQVTFRKKTVFQLVYFTITVEYT